MASGKLSAYGHMFGTSQANLCCFTQCFVDVSKSDCIALTYLVPVGSLGSLRLGSEADLWATKVVLELVALLPELPSLETVLTS